MEHRPALETAKESPDALPATGFPVLLQHQQRVIGGPFESPTAVRVAGQTDKAMQKVITGIRVGFDVVKQYPWCLDQFWQGRRISQWLCMAIPLRSGLSHKGSRHRSVLFSKPLQLLSQALRISIRKCVQAINPQLKQHLPPLGTDTTDLTEMANPAGLGTAHPSPAAERTFAPIRCQRWWLSPFQISCQPAQCLIQLALQVLSESNLFFIEITTCSRQSQTINHRCLLKVCEQTS